MSKVPLQVKRENLVLHHGRLLLELLDPSRASSPTSRTLLMWLNHRHEVIGSVASTWSHPRNKLLLVSISGLCHYPNKKVK